jgi:hypothetical protein
MMAYSRMVASQGGITSGVCTPSMNQNVPSSYSRRSSLNTDEYAYRSCHPSAPGGVGISNGLGNRSAMMFLLERTAAGHHDRRIKGVANQQPTSGALRDGFSRVWTMLVIGSALHEAALGLRLHTVSGRLCSSRTSPETASMAHSTSCGQR